MFHSIMTPFRTGFNRHLVGTQPSNTEGVWGCQSATTVPLYITFDRFLATPRPVYLFDWNVVREGMQVGSMVGLNDQGEAVPITSGVPVIGQVMAVRNDHTLDIRLFNDAEIQDR